MLGALRLEVQPLHQRADTAAALLDRVVGEAAATAKDCQELSAQLNDASADLQAKLMEEIRKREALEERYQASMVDVSQALHVAVQDARARTEGQGHEMLAKLIASEARSKSLIDDAAEQTLNMLKLRDKDYIARLEAERQAFNEQVQKQCAENQEIAEALVQKAISTMRGELDNATKHSTMLGEQCMEQKARDLVAQMTEGFDAASRNAESVRDGCLASIHESAMASRKAVNETRDAFSAEAQTLRSLFSGLEIRTIQAAEDAECRAVDAATRRIEDTATDIRKELSESKHSLLDADETLRLNLRGELDKAVAKLESSMEEKAIAASSSQALSLAQVVSQIQSKLADELKLANEKTDQVRCQAADNLNKEVQERCQALQAAESAREVLVTTLREELKSSQTEAIAQSTALCDYVDRRVDAAVDAITGLDRGLEAFSKEQSDTNTSLRDQLKIERQRTEDMGAEATQLTHQVRDNLEAHLQSEAIDLRAGVADTRKKVYEEINSLRAELREQPTKRELVELASTTTEQYKEIHGIIDTQRSRLEEAVADHGSRVRDARNETNDVRNRMQRETMALATELTQLRAAATSLANGLLRALHVIGFIREDVESSSSRAEDHHRSVEIEEFLEWEKVGKSLATRITRQWNLKESAGIPSVLSLVESKADTREIEDLRSWIRDRLPRASEAKLNETGSTMAPTSPALPKTSSETLPSSVNKVREQRLLGTDTAAEAPQ